MTQAYWFIFFLVIAPVVGWKEKPLAIPDSIHTANKLPVKKED